MDTIDAQLEKFAKSDLRAARREGEIMIGGTTRGRLTLSFSEGVYLLSCFDFSRMASEVLAEGKPATVVPDLSALYSVE